MKTLLNTQTEKTEQALRAIAHMPTKSLPVLMDDDFAQRLTDSDFMHIAVLLAQKSVVVGDITNAFGTEALLQKKGVQVEILEDPQGIELYARFRVEKPDQDLEDWRGLSALKKNHNK